MSTVSNSVNSFNSFNSYSAVLPPSPMVFFIMLCFDFHVYLFLHFTMTQCKNILTIKDNSVALVRESPEYLVCLPPVIDLCPFCLSFTQITTTAIQVRRLLALELLDLF